MGFFILLGDCQPLTADLTDHLGARNEAGSIAYVYYLEGACGPWIRLVEDSAPYYDFALTWILSLLKTTS